MRQSSKWSSIYIDGDVFIEGIWGLKWCPSDKALKARDRWEKSVDQIVTHLTGKHTGWNVMNALHRSKHGVVIVPSMSDDCAPTAEPLDDSDDAKRAASRKGTSVLHCYQSPKGENRGTGTGTDAKITFSPANWRSNGGCHPGGAGRDRDEVLLHELVHAMRITRGLMNQCYEATIRGFTNQEEFMAVVISNVYSSETGRALRKDHAGFDKLPRKTKLFNRKLKRVEVDLHNAQKFCNWFRKQLEEFRRHQGPLAQKLAKLTWIEWNPFVYL